MSLFTNPDSPSQKYSSKLKRLPNKRHSHSRSSRPSSYASTSSHPSSARSFVSIPPPTPPLSPSDSVSTFSTSMLNGMGNGKGKQMERNFMDRCLLIRTLHAPCGHVMHLCLHEAPCRIPYYGIVSSSSHLARAGVCEDMSVHLSINRRCCEECRESQNQSQKVLEKTGGWFRGKWGGNGNRKGDGGDERMRDENALPMKTIVERREKWIRDVEEQEARIARRRVERLRESVRSDLGFEHEAMK